MINQREQFLNDGHSYDLHLRINLLEESLAELKKEVGRIDNAEQLFIDTHEKSFPLRNYQKKLESQLFHLILSANVLSSNQIKSLPSKTQTGIDITNSAIGSLPFIGSTMRGIGESVSAPAKIALDNKTIRESTYIARIFGTPDHMNWIIKQLARKLTLARLTDLTKNKSPSQSKLMFNSFNAKLLGHGDMREEEVVAYQDAKMILDIAMDSADEIFKKEYERNYHVYILDMILGNILGDNYKAELNKLLHLQTTDSEEKEPKNISEFKIIDSYISKPEIKKNNTIDAQYIPISTECPTDFKNIVSIHPKKGGANMGSNVSALDQKGNKITFTIKQGRDIGHTLADIFGYEVMRGMINQVNNIDQKNISTDEIKKIIIAPSHMVLKIQENKSTSIEEMTKQIWVASEWSQDAVSIEICKLFGLEKRPMMAGTFKKYLFSHLRELNEKCQLGLEFALIPAIFTADKDLHLENILLKINTTNVKSNHKLQVDELLKEFQSAIKMQSKMTAAEHLIRLIDLIQNLQALGVYVYFQKIDHDNAFRHFSNPGEQVTLDKHRTSPLCISKNGIETQATLHIAELTGTDEKALDQLLLSPDAIKLLKINTLNHFINIIKLSANKLFQDIQNATSFMDTSNENKKCVEYQLLNQFYYYISELTFELEKDKEIDFQIQLLKNQIVKQLSIGSLYKVSDLYIQVYERLSVKKPKGELTITLVCFGDYLLGELGSYQAEYLYQQWEKIKYHYMKGQKKLLGIFPTSCSNESSKLINDLEAIFSVLNPESKSYNTIYAIYDRNTLLSMVFDKASNYLLNNSHRRLGKIISQELNVVNGFEKLSKIEGIAKLKM